MTHAHIHRQTDKCKSRADPTRGGSAKNYYENAVPVKSLARSYSIHDATIQIIK